MLIRPYTEADFEGIKTVIQSIQTTECWPHYYPSGWDEKRIREEFNPIGRYKNPLFLVADNAKIVGLVAGHDLMPFIENETSHLEQAFREHNLFRRNVYYQRDIIVHSDHQRSPVGIKLFNELKRHATRTG